MKNLFDEIYRMGTDEEENRLYRLRRCCEDVLESLGAPTTLNGYRYAERMLLYALYADKPQPIAFCSSMSQRRRTSRSER